MTPDIRCLTPQDVPLLQALSSMFGEAFNEPDTYAGKRPGPDYLRRLLESDTFIALVALAGDEVVGGIAAYEFRKFEQERSEIYLYDLAVSAAHRRKGIATALIERLKEIAAARGVYVIVVQAYNETEDQPAIALYSRFSASDDILHFEIPPAARGAAK